MTSLVLGVVGTAIGGPIGGFIGSAIGSVVDSYLFAPKMPDVVGPRLSDLAVQTASPGAPIPRVWGRARTAGLLIWKTDLVETVHRKKVRGGKGGGGKSSTQTTYTYSVSCAVLVCKGPIRAIKRIWADSKLIYDADAGSTYSQLGALRIYLGTADQDPDPLIEATEGAAPGFRGRAYVVFETLQLADFANRTPNFTFDVDHGDDVVADVIDDLATEVGVPADALDLSWVQALPVRGYVVARPTSVRSALETLMLAVPFDVVEAGGTLLARPLRRWPEARVLPEHFGAHLPADDLPPLRSYRRLQDPDLPDEVVLVYQDPARDYQQNVASQRRPIGGGVGTETIDVPVVLTAEEAAQVVDRRLATQWLQRQVQVWTLPRQYMILDPSDLVTVAEDDGDRLVRYRLIRRTISGPVIEFEVVPDHPALHQSVAVGDSGTVAANTVYVAGDTTAYLLDHPIVHPIDDDFGFTVAMAPADGAEDWRGATLYRRVGSEDVSLLDVSIASTVGTVSGVIPAGPEDYWDRATTITVVLTSGELESRTEDDLLKSPVNLALVGDELIQFAAAALTAANTYQLSTLLRARAGTEWAMTTHADGERFVLLEDGVVERWRGDGSAALGVAYDYRPVTVGQQVAAVSATSFTNTGRAKRPRSPVHIAGSLDAGTGDWTITWVRRTRVGGAWKDGTDVPLSEESERYEVDILDGPGGAVLRTISATSQTCGYSAAEQTADFGSPQSSITVKVYQLSAAVGRGFGREATL